MQWSSKLIFYLLVALDIDFNNSKIMLLFRDYGQMLPKIVLMAGRSYIYLTKNYFMFLYLIYCFSWPCFDVFLTVSIFVALPPIGKRSIVMSVCVFVCLWSYLRNYTSDLHQIFLCSLPVAVAQSSSGGIVIHYVLPVLWMTSYLLISQGCSTSPPSWRAVHMQPWAWL